MRNTLIIGLAAATLGLASIAGVAVAQDTPAVKSGPPSIDWPIDDLLADAGAKAVLTKDLPQLMSYDGLDQIKGMSLRQLSQHPQANLDDAKLAAVQADLAVVIPAN